MTTRRDLIASLPALAGAVASVDLIERPAYAVIVTLKDSLDNFDLDAMESDLEATFPDSRVLIVDGRLASVEIVEEASET